MTEPKKTRKPKSRYNVPELADLGWTDDDFTSRPSYVSAVPGQQPGRTGGGAAGVNLPEIPIATKNPSAGMNSGANVGLGSNSIGATGNVNGALQAGLVTPEQQGKMQGILADPNKTLQDARKRVLEDSQAENKSLLDQGKNWLANLFDAEDEEKEVFGEAVWDAGLKGIGWFYDRIAQGGSWTFSAAPGGIPTLGWEQAGEISPGQVAAVSAARNIQQYGAGAGQLLNLATSPFQAWAGTAAAINPEAKFAQENFNYLDAEARRQAFEQDALGKWVSGIPDTIFSLFADPLIVGGKALKVARIRWIDRPLVNGEQVQQMSREIVEDVAAIKKNEPVKSASGEFIKWVLEKKPDGTRARTATEISKHRWVNTLGGETDAVTGAFMAAQNEDEVSVLMRNLINDTSARKELIDMRTDLAASVASARREMLNARMRMDPTKAGLVKAEQAKEAITAGKNYRAAKEALDAGRGNAEMVERLRLDWQKKIIDQNEIGAFNARDPLLVPATADEVALAQKTYDQLLNRDRFFAKALDDEMMMTALTAPAGMPGASAFGLMVERSRQARATAAAQAQGSQGRFWRHDDFYSASTPQQILRLWRWPGFERASGYFQTKGAGNINQGREVQAIFNGLEIYRGAPREVTIDGKTQFIGGVAGREKLFNDYVATVGSGVMDQDSMARYIDRLEETITNDISMYYGLTRKEADDILNNARDSRTKILREIKDKKFWVEKDADGKTIIHKAPYIESQLENGTYMLNFTVMEREIRQFADKAKKGMVDRLLDTDSVEDATLKAANLYSAFNNLWRPAVLLRLGYTQRNVAEGTFRSSAYLSSIAPWGWLGTQAKNGISNGVKKRALARDLERIDAGAKATGTDVAKYAVTNSKRFKSWISAQEEAFEIRIANDKAFVQTMEKAITKNGLEGVYVDDAIKTLELTRMQIRELETQKQLLMDDPAAALAMYRKQGAAKRMMFDGTNDVDGVTYREAFADPNYQVIALSNLSAGNTMKTTLSLREAAVNNIWKQIQMKHYQEVVPSDGDAYFQGVSAMLRQFRNSEVGEKILAGEDPDKIAQWLMTDEVGMEISRFVNGLVADGRVVTDKTPGFNTADYDGALGYVNSLIGRLNVLAPNPELRNALRLTDVDAKDVKRLLDTDEYRDMLQPAVGSMATIVGQKGIREQWTQFTGKAFEWLGSMPEDFFVRAPFYGRRYNDFMSAGIRLIKSQDPNGFVSAVELNRLQRIAHRRALYETKNTLYTIDRRTNLGHYAEWMFPFISATQNSVTALGKLTWRDPALPGMLAAVWNLPEKMDIEDDQGNIVMALPLDLIPQGIKDSLGMDNILNMKFSKQGINPIFQQTGFGFIPRMGPFAGVPTAEFMKRGWFGMSLETPQWLSSAFGEETGGAIWATWRDYVFGEERGASPDFASWTSISPPFATKLIQMMQGMDSAAYASIYNKHAQTEQAKYVTGQRENIPDPDELLAKTNWFFGIRALGNLLAFTPPQYGFKVDPLVEIYRMYQRVYGDQADAKFNAEFGNLALMVSDRPTSKNVAGGMATLDAVGRARKYEDLIRDVAPNVQDNLNVLGIILNGDVNAEYDPSAVTWQSINKIPGLNRTYRELMDPAQAVVESSRTAGWVAFLSFMDQQDAILQQRGLTSYRSAQAKDLRENKRQFIEAARNNQLYSGWYDDYITFGSARTENAVETLKMALSNRNFMEDHKDNPIWQAAYLYVTAREDIVNAVQASGSGITAKKNQGIYEDWVVFRQNLINRFNGWGTIANRYLDGDDDPTGISSSLSTLYGDAEPVGVELTNSGYLADEEAGTEGM